MYLYLAKILFYFELPKGGVAYIIMPYIALGLCCQGLRLLLIDAKWTGFYRVFAYLYCATGFTLGRHPHAYYHLWFNRNPRYACRARQYDDLVYFIFHDAALATISLI